MIRNFSKAIFSAAALVFLSAITFIFSGCFQLQTGSSGAVVFNIKTSRTVGNDSFDFTDAFITVELRGEYSESKTQAFIPDVNNQITFSEVPAGKTIYIYAEIFKMIQNQSGVAVKTVYYTGQSEAKEITEGVNQFTVRFIRQNTETQGTEDTDPQNPQQPQQPQEPEEVIEYIEIYISASGQPYVAGTYSEGDEAHPFKYVADAVSKIIDEGDSESYWKILISGEVTGEPLGTSGINASYGHIEIPAEITTSNAKSIIITGATPHENWLTGSVPSDLDTINRGATPSYGTTLSSGNNISGTALIINTEVPVTLTNMKITGGYGSNGGAITISEGATVSIGDGVLITGNRASKGGAIFNQGTLFIYGTAVIGDKDSTTFAIDSSSSVGNGTAANYANNAGGIYNGDTANTVSQTSIIAHLYLGYKPSENGTPIAATLSGGIYFNGSTQGGAITNARKSYVYMNSGIIKNNGVSQYGGGICNEDSGYVEISGGQIIHNSTSNSSSVPYGGGICNRYAGSTLVLSGGTINENQAWATGNSPTTDGKGGGVYNCGKLFMYGTAVIGNKNVNTPAAETEGNYGNRANIGGGIYNEGSSSDYKGKLYIGYSRNEQDGTPEEADLDGGVYYNFSKHANSTTSIGGGGIFNYSSSNGLFLMYSGTIAYNSTDDNGGGIWMHDTTLSGGGSYGISIHDNTAAGKGNGIFVDTDSDNYLTLSGDLDIDYGNDIYLAGTENNYSRILISDYVIGSLSAIITPQQYNATHRLVNLTSQFQTDLGDNAGQELEAECLCFDVTPQTVDDDGGILDPEVNWIINSTGYLEQE